MSDEGKKKVDEDWKRRAQLEREADAAKAGGPKPAPAAAAAAGTGTAAGTEAPPADNGIKVNPLFPGLVESLASQALMFMGGMRDPMTGQVMQDLNQAQTMIDMLLMLEEKTKGNLATQEAEMLKQVLDELRTQFVRVANPAPRVPKPPMMGNRPPGR
ncbi:MAG TPA: DUF1844 domain-containing protein [Planctomycetota bacterium]